MGELLKRGADPDLECRGHPPLFVCALHGEVCWCYCYFYFVFTDVMIEIAAMRCLLKNGANVNAVSKKATVSALHLGAWKGIVELCEVVVRVRLLPCVLSGCWVDGVRR